MPKYVEVFPGGQKGRDMVGYGNKTPSRERCWPNGARIAVSFVLNYEEGGENCVLHGDDRSEHLLCDIVNATPWMGRRNLNVESMYEYGSRAGFWRLLRLFEKYKLPATVYAVGMALERNPEASAAMASHPLLEIASHGYRWLEYESVAEDIEREHIKLAVSSTEATVGKRPLGLYQGKPSVNTRRLIVEEGGFLYDCDAYSDDLPFWTYWKELSEDGKEEETAPIKPHLVIPYALDTNDMRMFSLEGAIFDYIKEAFDCLYEEGDTAPKMLNIGLHGRGAGRPGRAGLLDKFLAYITSKEDVWVCTREQIARHWHENHPAPHATA